MLRTLLAMLALAALVAPPSGADEAAASGDGPPTWYAQTLTRGEGGLNVTHFWSKGPWLRSETVVAGHKVVNIVRGEWYWAYDALAGTGLAIRREPKVVAADRPDVRPFGREYQTLVEQGAELIRQEELLGRAAGVYRVTDGLGKRELWVTEDDARIPLRLEIFDRRSAGRRTTDWVNWQRDLRIPDAFFAPDAGARLEEMDHTEYLRRSSQEGSLGPVPVFYLRLLFERTE
jgi:hypothetical protein